MLIFLLIYVNFTQIKHTISKSLFLLKLAIHMFSNLLYNNNNDDNHDNN